MAPRTQPPHDETTAERRSPATNSIDPDGTDPETEGDGLDAAAVDDGDDGVEPDGARDDSPDNSTKTNH